MAVGQQPTILRTININKVLSLPMECFTSFTTTKAQFVEGKDGRRLGSQRLKFLYLGLLVIKVVGCGCICIFCRVILGNPVPQQSFSATEDCIQQVISLTSADAKFTIFSELNIHLLLQCLGPKTFFMQYNSTHR